MNTHLIKPKVFVGLSGGVDSAVSAGLLKKAEFDVTGVFIKAWSPFDNAQGKPKYHCTWKEDRRSAMRACAVLDIPFLTLDLEKEYKSEVVDYMIQEYKEGKTPNPDVMCNKEIKFGHFLKFALENGADFVATGHYARNELREASNELRERNVPRHSYFVLREGADPNKDQSYFLWTLTERELKHILFPIGHLQKSEVRKLATEMGLPQATRKDSQGLCFLGQIDMKEFLRDYVSTKEGDVLGVSGNKIGKHNGAVLYTLGERHGFEITNKNTESEPLYVVDKNLEDNTITVAPKESSAEMKFANSYNLEDVNWTLGEVPRGTIHCRYRYRQTKIDCRVITNHDKPDQKSVVEFNEPELIASGQSIVFYMPATDKGDSEICLGGAIITTPCKTTS